ncbi:hypothetical protein ACFFX1_52540 [Dactylosporangium sucinum]|uniref:Uncharacterized protein n=1 Tax=Dactylosporangium sucinum TaxID=1424081 RepID=A0A917UBQ1_9ACTN|nr:hypothetical protein GCM10007977_093620 [Dactylosporangium sucinum]GGM77794.1 hypothetical protein GCM10007977_094070 [Dactylosporangium sucinum]
MATTLLAAAIVTGVRTVLIALCVPAVRRRPAAGGSADPPRAAWLAARVAPLPEAVSEPRR